ncbi:hypothetical protein DITRI_Ditri09bG0156000 [Diplodiscus trichospermus]
MFYAVISVCALMAFATIVTRPVLHWIINTTPKGKPVKECYVIAILLWTMLLGVGTDAFGSSFSPATIVMGFFIPDGPPLGATIIQKCELIISDFFLSFFFIWIGYFTNLSAIKNWKEFATFGAVVHVGYIGRLTGSVLVSSSFNMSNNTALLLSFVLSLQGVIELLHVIRWKHQKLLGDQNFATFVINIVILNAIITPIIKILYKPEKKTPNSVKQRPTSLAMASNIGELQIITCVQDEDNVPTSISLLKALNPKVVSPICAYVIHLVALASQAVPTLAPYKNHKRKFSKPNGSDNIMRAFLNFAANSQGPVQCTVRILVDRGLCTRIGLTSFSYNVEVIFFGGADDREALAFTARMSSHPNVAITVLRLHLRGNYMLELDIERERDESWFREFKAMNDGIACVVCHELVVHDSEEAMNALRSLPNTYNLVVVGKRQGIPHFED